MVVIGSIVTKEGLQVMSPAGELRDVDAAVRQFWETPEVQAELVEKLLPATTGGVEST